MKVGKFMKNFLCRPTRSLRELFGIIIVVSIVSVIVTYNVSKYVLQKDQAELKIHFNGRVDIYRKFHLEQNGAVADGNADQNPDKHHRLEGMDLDRRSKQRKRSKDIRRPPTALEKKLRQVSCFYFCQRSRASTV